MRRWGGFPIISVVGESTDYQGRRRESGDARDTRLNGVARSLLPGRNQSASEEDSCVRPPHHRASGNGRDFAPRTADMASDSLDLELTTMQNIAAALAGLDAPARSRVLLWLRLRFDADDAGPAEAAVAADEEATAFPALRILSMPTPIADYDDTLSVDGLAELFDDRRVVTPAAEPPP